MIRTSDLTSELFPALLEAKRDMGPVFKAKKNDHFRYSYANEEAWFDAVQPSLLKHGLVLTFSVHSTNRTGSLTTIIGGARVTHAASGQWMQVEGVGEGEDKNDKAAYKAQTGLKKYLYALAFSLPTTDDAEDAENDRRRAAAEVKAKAKVETPHASTADVNARLVAEGLSPEIDVEARARAKVLFDQAKLIDKEEANRIKRKFGTDYARIEEEMTIFLSGVPKKETTP